MNAIDTLIRAALETGRPTQHDCDPRDFGGAALFRDCLASLLTRYPDIRVEISGPWPALQALDLRPGFLNSIGAHHVGAYCAPSSGAGRVRLHFIGRQAAARSKFADIEAA